MLFMIAPHASALSASHSDKHKIPRMKLFLTRREIVFAGIEGVGDLLAGVLGPVHTHPLICGECSFMSDVLAGSSLC